MGSRGLMIRIVPASISALALIVFSIDLNFHFPFLDQPLRWYRESTLILRFQCTTLGHVTVKRSPTPYCGLVAGSVLSG